MNLSSPRYLTLGYQFFFFIISFNMVAIIKDLRNYNTLTSRILSAAVFFLIVFHAYSAIFHYINNDRMPVFNHRAVGYYLKRAGISPFIGNYWDVYIYSSFYPRSLIGVPQEGYELRNDEDLPIFLDSNDVYFVKGRFGKKPPDSFLNYNNQFVRDMTYNPNTPFKFLNVYKYEKVAASKTSQDKSDTGFSK